MSCLALTLSLTNSSLSTPLPLAHDPSVSQEKKVRSPRLLFGLVLSCLLYLVMSCLVCKSYFIKTIIKLEACIMSFVFCLGLSLNLKY